jgi:PAS domain S-box-containing protein
MAAGALAFAGGVVTLLGWAFAVPRLTDWAGTGIAMFTNTALCASTSGVALMLLAFQAGGRHWRRTGVRICAAFVALLAAVILSQHLTGVSLGIDTLLFDRPWGQRAAAAPMRMGPPASVSFVVLGFGLFFATCAPRARRLAAALATFAVAVASLSLIGYWFGSDQLYTLVHLSAIALQTSIVIALLGVGLMAAIPEYGIVSLLCRDDAGGILVRRLLLPIIGGPLLLGWLRVLGEEAGLYNTGFGRSILLFSMIAMLLTLLALTASSLSRKEETLREREQRYALVLAGAEAAIWDWDVASRRVMYSPRWKQLRGLTDEDVGDSEDEWISRIHPDDLERVMAAVQSHFDGHTPIFAEDYRVQHKEGHLVRVLNRGIARRNAAGQVVRMAGSETDITERKRAEDELRRAEERMRSVVDHVVDGIITIDEGGNVESFNPAAEKLFGYRHREIIGRNVKVLMPDPYQSEHDGYLQNFLATGQAKIIGTGREVFGKRKDGSTFPMELAVSAFRIGTRRYFTGIVRDITERKLLEAQLQQRIDELAESDQRKNEFIATLAHELRNPLAPIRNSLQILSMTPAVDGSTRNLHEIMERQVNHMVRLVDDLLEVSRITSGKIELRTQQVEIASVIHSAVETSKPLIEANGHRLMLTVPPDALTVMADPVRLSQVVANLLNNAAKYTEPGGSIWLCASRQHGDVSISVRDTGVGISPALLPQIFQMFAQADKDHKRAQGGLGIGLALAKRLIEMHGGRLEVHSDGRGRGSEFVIRLPLVEPRTPIAERATPVDFNGQPAPSSRVLVVDDNVDAAASLAMLLTALGHEVRAANDGASALEAIRSFNPSVVLLDLGMPGMSGYEVARRARTMLTGKPTVLIALTGWGQEDDRRRTREAGFDHHLVKPVEIKTLKALLSEVEFENLANGTGDSHAAISTG